MNSLPTVRTSRTGSVSRALAASLLAGMGLLVGSGQAVALQVPAADTNVLFPIQYIEQRLNAPHLEILGMDRTRHLEEDRSRRVTLAGHNGEPDLQVHWKPVAPPGHGFNNEPRYELAAYRFQTMFLDEQDYVVPPKVLRALPLEEYRQHRAVRGPTLRGTRSVLFLLSYWLQNLAVDTVDPFDRGLFDRDRTYARHFANANLLTHLIDHKDGNHGNMVVSMDPANRRVFALDNDVAFRSQVSSLGDRWRHLQVPQLPASSVARLRALTRADLERELGVLAEFEIVEGELQPTVPGPNLALHQGVRIRQGRVQFGLTLGEIRDLERRIERLLRDVERGRITTF